MRQTSSHHSESLRALPSRYWNAYQHRNDFRPALNVPRLISLIESFRRAQSKSSKKKRASQSISDPRRSKRAKLSSRSSATSSASESEDATSEIDEIDDYPWLPPLSASRREIRDASPVFHHISEIEYNMDVPEVRNFADDQSALAMNWVEQETNLIKIVEKLISEGSQPRTINLSQVSISEHNGRLVATLEHEDNRLEWLALVPALSDDEFDPTALDLGDHCRDLLAACVTLQSAGRVAIDGELNLVVFLPDGESELDTLPFRLQISISVSLILPAISAPITGKVKRTVTLIEDAQRRLLDFAFPSTLSQVESPFAGDANIPFFYSILGPAPELPSKLAEAAMQPPSLRPTLLPFQRRSVGWLLDREGKTVTRSGEIVPKKTQSGSDLPLFWDEIPLANESWYLNRLSGTLISSRPCSQFEMGGILAEEPGLGKTLMCIGLILLNPAPTRNPSIKCWDPIANLDVKEVKTTLIVTPPSLASQWVDELKLHAPSLKVFVYEGWSKVSASIAAANGVGKGRAQKGKSKANGKAAANRKPKANAPATRRTRTNARRTRVDDSDSKEATPDAMEVDSTTNEDALDWCSFINKFDVCVTTYSVLRQDLNVARAPPVRPRREDVVYLSVEQPRSPLVKCEWYRVIMDEVQMVGGGKIEDMVSLLPRLSSFAVSGTPARAQVADLIHVLRFLRVDTLVGSLKMWNRLLKPGFSQYFSALFGNYTIRTMKSTVAHELTIPQQTRFLVGIELGRVERHVYDQALEAALLELGLDARGVASTEDWEVDSVLLRSLLRRLRGICTHPQVGQLQRPGENLHKQGALKTMAEVLEGMKDQNWRSLLDDRHQKVQILVRFAGLQQRDEADRTRYQHALETLLVAEQEIKQVIEDVKAAIAEHATIGEALKQEALASRNARQRSVAPASDDNATGKGKGKAQDDDEASDVDDNDLPRTLAGEEHASKRRALQLRLREYKVTLHKVKFLQGDVNHVLGGGHSRAEDAAYEGAEEIRQDLLKSYEASATNAMNQLHRDFANKGLTQESLLIPVPFGDEGMKRTVDLMAEANEIIEGLLNEQSNLLWLWREQIYDLLTRKLAGTGEADGQEYTRTLDTQGEAEAYLQAFAALLADRREVLVAERTLLAAHDVREKKLRHTKAARKAALAAASLHADAPIPEDVEMQPEHEVLHKTLSDERKDLIKQFQFQGRAIRSIVFDLNAVAAKIHIDKDPEKINARKCSAELRQLITEQTTLMDKLEADLTQFRKAFNERILYFRQLQELSDSVAEVAWQGRLQDAKEACTVEQNDIEDRIKTNRARQRYLVHLAKNVEDGTVDEDDETCILCRCDFARGFITPCAHIFCEDCLKAWLLRKEGKACPVCRVVINADQMQRFTVQGDQPNRPKPVIGEAVPKSHREFSYNMIDRDLFKDIQSMESHGSYGSKIQTLIRHLLYLQVAEPEAKSIVFSAWADSLHIIEHALRTNGIGFLRIDQTSKKESAAKRFKTDPTIPVLLLHGERENAGLNLTCASRVFLVESVVHHGFELQAIARIDRMSQEHETEVYCYYAEGAMRLPFFSFLSSFCAHDEQKKKKIPPQTRSSATFSISQPDKANRSTPKTTRQAPSTSRPSPSTRRSSAKANGSRPARGGHSRLRRVISSSRRKTCWRSCSHTCSKTSNTSFPRTSSCRPRKASRRKPPLGRVGQSKSTRSPALPAIRDS